MAESVTMTVNGRTSEHQVEARRLLVHHLRDELRLTGTHVGCDTSSCGACTAIVDGKAPATAGMEYHQRHETDAPQG